jgi:hypothetical protein
MKDPSKRKEFNDYRDKIMDSYNLSEDDKKVIMSKDPEKIRTAIQQSLTELGMTHVAADSDIRVDISITISVDVFAE